MLIDIFIEKMKNKKPDYIPHTTLPADLRKALAEAPKARAAWKDITPLARNEWICLVTSTRNPETRNRRLQRMIGQLSDSKRRPCCWAGCPHRFR